ncbi:phosphoglycerate dehydrogenase [Rubinisphaera brasiliensis]|uniref:Phosphoglycerate dehydrogenase n=1 Tax=Rubinisphaera brasiliensis (strain ATCC 49424 / DSM 5305 / JCM 21570 / IAM 15109 / NBRC 103401 / IFAM 1448) TaxID=756272 RepID=F0SMY8_RUBBR|nr:phosphoglycerate dehydrogenase [Rubinisphaera brasiliensis]ADY59992.1 Phosphoglycerate dehydrogenase [Rubinisphaera brasiliensis DSM 5305]
MKVRCTALSSDEGPHFPLLNQAGFEVLPGNRERNYWNASELIAELEGCVAVVAGSEPYTVEVLDALPQLRVIARTGVGFDAIDLAACAERNVVVTTTPGVNHHAVAEHAIALLMGVARGFPDRDRLVREGNWQRFNTPRVMGSTLGLVGLGRIGRATAQRGVGLGMRVLGFDPFADADEMGKLGIELVTLDELFAQSDYVSLHLPATAETKHFINAETLAQMKPGSVLINTARGSLVDENALVESLKSGHLRGAGLDVFEKEPLPLDSPLLSVDRILLCGHLAGLDEESQRDTLTMAAETIIDLHKGGWPEFCIQSKNASGWSWAR